MILCLLLQSLGLSALSLLWAVLFLAGFLGTRIGLRESKPALKKLNADSEATKCLNSGTYSEASDLPQFRS